MIKLLEIKKIIFWLIVNGVSIFLAIFFKNVELEGVFLLIQEQIDLLIGTEQVAHFFALYIVSFAFILVLYSLFYLIYSLITGVKKSLRVVR